MVNKCGHFKGLRLSEIMQKAKYRENAAITISMIGKGLSLTG